MLSVLCPTIFMAVDRGTPARSRFRTAVRRKSCGMRPARPAAVQAVSQARRKDLIGRPDRRDSHGMIVRVAFSTARVRALPLQHGPQGGGERELAPFRVLGLARLQAQPAALEVPRGPTAASGAPISRASRGGRRPQRSVRWACWGGPTPLDQRSVLGETPVTRWLSALYRRAGRGRRVVPRTEGPLTGPLSCLRSDPGPVAS